MTRKSKTLTTDEAANVAAAVARFYRRRDRRENPEGSFDKAGRWYPDADEWHAMGNVRAPSRSWPYSYLKACRRLEACAHLEDADPAACRGVQATLSRSGVAPIYEPEGVSEAMQKAGFEIRDAEADGAELDT